MNKYQVEVSITRHYIVAAEAGSRGDTYDAVWEMNLNEVEEQGAHNFEHQNDTMNIYPIKETSCTQ